MVLFNYSTKELTAKVVYYGPGLCGKTTNLQWIHEKTPIKNKGKMLSLATEADRTLFFDFLPIDLGTIRGMKTRIQLYTVPGQVFYNATRRMVLKGADCVVFVADSQEPMLDANLDALANLRENLEANEIDPAEIPTVLQYNKRDLPNALPVEILNERLNPRGLIFFEAVAMKGHGVDETLKGATGLVFKSLAAKYGGGADAAVRSGPAAPSTNPALAAARAAAGPATLSPRPAVPVTAPPAPARPAPAAAAPRPLAPRGAAPTAAPTMAASDDLLDSIDLQPAGDLIDDTPEFSLAAGSEIESVSEDELSLETPAPRPHGANAGRTTLIRTASEADDMRARIGRTTDPELTLDAGDPDDEDIEEISFDTAPSLVPADEPEAAAPVRPAPRPPVPAPAPAPATPAARAAAPAPRTMPPARPPGPSAAAGSSTIPPVAAAPGPPARAGKPTENTAPIRVSATVTANEKSVVIPVDVTLRQGQGQVEIQLRIVLDLKVIE
jgi:signal recognition particle receptor subunit beta